ncbi:uncharacterized protein EMH_0018630 [Eimeria mitis]|uniref:Dynein regulatory complex subunit 7 C-terminal domain-containing protein n=1 Tax=Eimeria mitis TaxID=44415 RepID=U6KCW3_9EIME|nr:uncharacterized protein EMH_0018630 [Eimeria mitis]CDJ34077.1 hypothetical protein, conserved [Eimeria mitis]
MQRKLREAPSGSVELREAAQRQDELLFKIEILTQRLSRHETQALQKLNELQLAIARDPRLKAMWGDQSD